MMYSANSNQALSEEKAELWSKNMLGQYIRWARKLYEFNTDIIRQRLLFEGSDGYADLPKTIHEQAQCCFVLSTGRCGTKLLTHLLKASREIWSEHEPLPVLGHFSRLAYEASHEDDDKFRLGIDMARYELIKRAFLRDQTYVETNNKTTFLAHFLAHVFEKSKFIHLVRHPGDFVSSGVRRGWYSAKDSGSADRIVPNGSSADSWSEMRQIEKIAWLWNETNQFAEDFRADLKDSNRTMFVKSEELFSMPETVLRVFEFLQLRPLPEKKIQRMIKRPVNVQKQGDFPGYQQWNPEQKEQLKKYAILSSKYGYDL